LAAAPDLTADTVFRALADPTRRAVLDLLRDGERTASELGTSFVISQPALSQHLRALRDAGLVAGRSDGRKRYYRVDPTGLQVAYDWFGHYVHFWDAKLDALGEFLDA
jgi:DNA-binding transcriptional ArsR family regulator